MGIETIIFVGVLILVGIIWGLSGRKRPQGTPTDPAARKPGEQ